MSKAALSTAARQSTRGNTCPGTKLSCRFRVSLATCSRLAPSIRLYRAATIVIRSRPVPGQGRLRHAGQVFAANRYWGCRGARILRGLSHARCDGIEGQNVFRAIDASLLALVLARFQVPIVFP
jgi:hypothetical protein